MSHDVQLFVNINAFTDNTLDNTAPLGELSPNTRTFSTAKTEIASKDYDTISLTVFHNADNGVKILNLPVDNVGVSFGEYILPIMSDIVANLGNDTISDFINNNYSVGNTIGNEVLTYLESSNAITAVAGNPAITYSLPGYVKFAITIGNDVVDVTVYFSEAVMALNYKPYEIRLIPPIPNILDLDTTSVDVLNILTTYGVEDQINAQENARGDDPSTKVVPLKLKWVDLNNNNIVYLTWVLVVYGQEGLRIENQLEAIRNYLVTNSTIDISVWIQHFPELALTTVVTIIPIWDNPALPAVTGPAYVYSPTTTALSLTNLYSKLITPNTPLGLEDWIEYNVIGYKSISFIAVGLSLTNSPIRFSDLYPDYSIIPINDLNINRLQARTRDAIIAIEEGLRYAEQANTVGIINPNYVKVDDGGILYVTYTVDNVVHRIVTRESYSAL